jgi:hypothetical protein
MSARRRSLIGWAKSLPKPARKPKVQKPTRKRTKKRLRLKPVPPRPRCCAIQISSGKRCPCELRIKREREAGFCSEHLTHGFLVFEGSFATPSEIDFFSWAKWNDVREMWKVRGAELARLSRINDILARARTVNPDVWRSTVEFAITRADLGHPEELEALVGAQTVTA